MKFWIELGEMRIICTPLDARAASMSLYSVREEGLSESAACPALQGMRLSFSSLPPPLRTHQLRRDTPVGGVHEDIIFVQASNGAAGGLPEREEQTNGGEGPVQMEVGAKGDTVSVNTTLPKPKSSSVRTHFSPPDKVERSLLRLVFTPSLLV